MKKAGEVHGEFGKKAADYLVAGMPGEDAKNLSTELLMENLDYAMKARKKYKWCQDLPEEVFFNDVLPYAVFDETREAWRKEFFEKCGELVKDCKTAEEAAQVLNRDFFNLIKVHYNTGRKKAEPESVGIARTGDGDLHGALDYPGGCLSQRGGFRRVGRGRHCGRTSGGTTPGWRFLWTGNGNSRGRMNMTKRGWIAGGSRGMPRRRLPTTGNTRSGRLRGSRRGIIFRWCGI